jgi:nitrate reductase gamma subunit
MATTKNDKTMYVFLVAAIVLGLATTVLGSGLVGEEHNYRETVSPWFRSVFVLQADVDAMSAAPLSFQLHTLVGMALFALWPFTRLVHAFTAPVAYLFRPYVLYRSRDDAPRPPRRGWERIGS